MNLDSLRCLVSSLLIVLAVLVVAPPAHATFSGENGRVAFVRYHQNENGDIYTINADASGLRRLTNNEVFGGDSAYDSAPTWSPDGQWILFYRIRDEQPVGSGIFTMSADGSNLTRLDGPDGSSASWLADGRVVYVAQRPDPGIYTVNPDGTGRTRVGPDPQGSGLSWSRDGRQVAFTGCCGEPGPLDVVTLNTMNMDGSELREILQFHRYSYPSPVWGPGPTIAFTRFHLSGGSDIYTINFDGSGETTLTNDAEYDLDPEWSPEGSKLLFVSTRNSRPDDVFDLFTIKPDGTGLMNLTGESTGSDLSAEWSPDGRRLAFNSFLDDTGGLFTVDANGTSRTRLTSNFGEVHDDQPAWQPLVRSSFHNGTAFCRAHREAVGATRFAERYGDSRNGESAFGRCVSGKK